MFLILLRALLTTLGVPGARNGSVYILINRVAVEYSSGGWEYLSLDFHLLVMLRKVVFAVQNLKCVQAMLLLSSE